MLSAELVPNRRLTRIYPRANLITFEKYQQQQQQQLQHKAAANEARKGSKGFRIVKELIGELGQQTSIPGLSKPLAPNMGAVERLFWTIGFLCALGMMIYVIQMLAARYNRQQFKTIVNATNYPIYRIVFPEIYLCNQNRLNWARFDSAKENYLRREHHNTELEHLFTEVVALYDTFYFGSFDIFEKLNTTRPLHELDYVNFTLVAQFMAWRCDELLTDCVWRHRPMNCCDIFSARRSTYGFCMAFNTLETVQGQLRQKLDDKWPWRATRNGPGNGLNVRVLINEQMHSPFASRDKGIMFMLMEPGVWWSYPNQVHVNNQIRVKLDAQLSFYDETTRRLSSQVRECVFDDERNSLDFKTLMNHKYMFENCQAECLQEHTMKYCNCSMDIFFPPSQYPACKLSDMPCLAQHNRHLKYFEQSGEKDAMPINVSAMGMVCECFLNCLSLAYLIEVRTNDLPTTTQMENNSHMDMDFFFIRNSIVVFRTKVIYTWVDLLVNFGNATALFLGCSIISGVELIYYFFVYLPQRLWRAHKKSRNRVNVSAEYKGKVAENWMTEIYDNNGAIKEPRDIKPKESGNPKTIYF